MQQMKPATLRPMKELSVDFIDALVAKSPTIELLPSGECVCGSKLDNGYCLNPECEWDAPEDVFDCEWCGCCPDPEHCVWSVTCPICESLPKKHCVEGTKLIGLHRERWEYAGGSFQR
jgi:hypothetical protein